MQQSQCDSQRLAEPQIADSAHWTKVGLFGDADPKMRMQGLRSEVRTPPLFASAYVHYTEQLEEYADILSRVMTISDVAELTGLSWDTVKDIVKKRLKKDYGHIELKGLRNLSIDEIYVGKPGPRQGRFTRLLASFAQEQSQDPGSGHGYEWGVLGCGAGSLAQGQGGV